MIFTFKDIKFKHDKEDKRHRLVVYPKDMTHIGPWCDIDKEPIISYEWNGRYFIAQILTNKLPPVFEVLPSQETLLQVIEK